jgi:hypothetical protein
MAIDAIGDTFNKVSNFIVETSNSAFDKIKSKYHFLGRKVQIWSQRNLSPETRKNIQNTYRAAPYTLALTPFIITGIGQLTASVALLATKHFEARGSISRQTAKNVYTGIRNACILGAGVSVLHSYYFSPLLISTLWYAVVGFNAQSQIDRINGRVPV